VERVHFILKADFITLYFFEVVHYPNVSFDLIFLFKLNYFFFRFGNLFLKGFFL